VPAALETHYRLRGGGDKGTPLCIGNENQNAIKRNLCLGGRFTTDIVELVLCDPSTGTPIRDETALASIAVALRQALAQDLGIDTRELGWDVGPSEDIEAGASPAIKLFDRAEGGAGYVAACPERLPQLLRRAREILACAVDEPCDKLCHRCLLSFDTQFDEPRLDRRKGHAALTDSLLEALELPSELRFLGPTTELECEGCATRIATELGRSDVEECRVYRGGDAGAWVLTDWDVWPLLARAASQQRRVVVVMSHALVAALPAEIANSLASRAEATGVQLRVVKDEELRIGGGWRVFETGGPSRSGVWLATASEALVPGPDYGRAITDARVVRNIAPTPMGNRPGDELPASKLRRTPPGLFHELLVSRELDGDISSFGARFWRLVRGAAPELDTRLAQGSPLSKVTYTDRYVRSPSVARLVAETLRELARVPGGISSATAIEVLTSPPAGTDSRSSFRLFHDWREARDQQGVIHALLFGTGVPSVRVDDKRATFHMRELRLAWGDGRAFAIRLDQGFGFFRTDGAHGDLSFNFNAPAAAQAQALQAARFAVTKADALPVPLYVRETTAK
jgi:hypothetical protein